MGNASRVVWLHSHFLLPTGGTKYIYEVVRRLGERRPVEVVVERASDYWRERYAASGIPLHEIAGATSTSKAYWLTFPRYLTHALGDLSAYGMRLVTEQEGGRSTWFGFSVLLDDSSRRRALCDHLEARNIATRPIVAGNLALQPAFRDNPHRVVGTLENATSIGERGLFIGNHPSLTPAHLDHIVLAFRDFFAS